MKKTQVHILDYRNLIRKKYEEDEAIILISESLDKVNEAKGLCELTLFLMFAEEGKETILTEEKEYLATQCSLEEIICLTEFCSAIDDYRNIYISDTGNLSRSWGIALGINYLYTQSTREAIYLTVKERPEIEPIYIWPIILFDEVFKLNNLLVREVDDYFASGMVIDSKGNIINGKWFKED